MYYIFYSHFANNTNNTGFVCFWDSMENSLLAQIEVNKPRKTNRSYLQHVGNVIPDEVTWLWRYASEQIGNGSDVRLRAHRSWYCALFVYFLMWVHSSLFFNKTYLVTIYFIWTSIFSLSYTSYWTWSFPLLFLYLLLSYTKKNFYWPMAGTRTIFITFTFSHTVTLWR